MSDQTGPVEGGLPVEIRRLVGKPGDSAYLARELVKFAKIIDESNERIDALTSTVAGLEARINAAR